MFVRQNDDVWQRKTGGECREKQEGRVHVQVNGDVYRWQCKRKTGEEWW